MLLCHLWPINIMLPINLWFRDVQPTQHVGQDAAVSAAVHACTGLRRNFNGTSNLVGCFGVDGILVVAQTLGGLSVRQMCAMTALFNQECSRVQDAAVLLLLGC